MWPRRSFTKASSYRELHGSNNWYPCWSNPSCIVRASKRAPDLCRGRRSRFSLWHIGALQEILTGLAEAHRDDAAPDPRPLTGIKGTDLRHLVAINSLQYKVMALHSRRNRIRSIIKFLNISEFTKRATAGCKEVNVMSCMVKWPAVQSDELLSTTSAS